ncbi:MAG: N-acetylmuramoyl-L-alanine amidase [Calothrix sp. SM1_5_4]|nr:N-acetylmuramoyl-L-alanine amidase [Calothrix sp. SM1_5_4]
MRLSFLLCMMLPPPLALCGHGAMATPPTKVMIDPGHGGRDDGTSRNRIREADITLSVARKLYSRLKTDRRFRPLITRDSDLKMTLNERARAAKEQDAEIFLSIHVNSSPDARAKGAEFYFQNQLPPDEESMFLAHRENDLESGAAEFTYPFLEKTRYPADVATIVTDLLDNDRILRSSRLSTALKQNWRGSRKSKTNSVRQAPFFVLSQMSAPSALVELGFLTNAEDFRLLTDPQAQEQMAEDLYRGLLQYRESITKGHAFRQP